jgi:hypothetical protein
VSAMYRRNVEWRYRHSSGEERAELRQVLVEVFDLSERAMNALDLLSVEFPDRLPLEAEKRICRRWDVYALPKTRKGVEGVYREAVMTADFKTATGNAMDRALYRAAVMESVLVDGYGYTEEQIDALSTLAHSVMGG